ncbi:EcsC family protein [Methylocaldum sp.]|uniref:EcsC family protein n=1 Tax=Methylocaldum sp. TaxID=1969727 RepID=UPI002D2FDCDD|nr:EcsC family protein [Methylocaldum sp.]HYE36874.1 EcsC family protein [Methylocaldum sp.]
MNTIPTALSREDYLSLKRAHRHLEHPSLAVRLADVIGTPLEKGVKLLPRQLHQGLQRCAENAIWRALGVAVASLKNKQGAASHDACYKLLGIASGAVGGFFGGPALLVELPFTTTLMLRSIADIARSTGENLDDIATRLACLEVFALGGRSKEDDAADTGYYGLRLALEMPVAAASSYIAQNGLANRAGAPMLVDFITMISSRFGITVSEKAAAEIIPIIGAVGGALINSVFIQHFQDTARSHFTIRRLERKYSPSLVQAEYYKLRSPEYRLLYAAA